MAAQIKVKYYSVEYFEHITGFDVPWHLASLKGVTHTHFIDAQPILISDASIKCL